MRITITFFVCLFIMAPAINAAWWSGNAADINISYDTTPDSLSSKQPRITVGPEGNLYCIWSHGPVSGDGEIHFGKSYNIGVKFEQINRADLQRIKRLIEMVDIIRLLNLAHSEKASDLHLTYGRPPILRVFGNLVPLDMEALFKEDLKAMIYSILTESQIKKFEKYKELDFAFSTEVLKAVAGARGLGLFQVGSCCGTDSQFLC